MIPRIAPSAHIPLWQEEQARAINTPEALFEHLGLPAELLLDAQKAHDRFPLRVPRPYLDRIQPGNIDDPLLKQILPLGAEMQDFPGESADPVGDSQSRRRPGLLHKYQGRVLLLLSQACAVHCRYCFRREFDYHNNRALGSQWLENIQYIQNDTSIYEVILSGGDPLSVQDNKLRDVIHDIAQIPHIRYLRLHTRTPVVIPARITEDLIDVLSTTHLKVSVVVHINHPREIDTALKDALARLTDANITLLNQAVLLRGINDTPDILVELSHVLYASGVLPYYLHTLDKVLGAGHFAIGDEEAIRLHQSIQARLPGYLVPRLVREIPGEAGKTLL